MVTWILGFLNEFFHQLAIGLTIAGLLGLLLSQFIKLIPYPGIAVYKPLIVLGSFLIFSLGLWWDGTFYSDKKWEKEVAQLKKEKEEAEKASKVVTEKIVTKYVDRIKTIKEKGETITQYVPQYITKEVDSKCPIPNAFVWLLDSAAKNEISRARQQANGTTTTAPDAKK